MKKKDEKTNYYFLLKYLTTVTTVATATIAVAAGIKYSTTALTMPFLTSSAAATPIFLSPFLQPLVIAAVTVALLAYIISCLFCTENTRTSIYTTLPTYVNYRYGDDLNTRLTFWNDYYNTDIQHHANINNGSTHNHNGSIFVQSSSIHDHERPGFIHKHR